MPSGTPGSVCPFRPPAPPKPIPRCLEQHRSVILHDSCDPEWSQRPHFLDSLKPHADVGLIDEKSGLAGSTVARLSGPRTPIANHFRQQRQVRDGIVWTFRLALLIR